MRELDKIHLLERVLDFPLFSYEVRLDFIEILKHLPDNARQPDIEYEDDGSMSVEWVGKDKMERCALFFSGHGNVVGTYVGRDSSKQQAWTYDVIRQAAKIASRINHSPFRSLMTGDK